MKSLGSLSVILLCILLFAGCSDSSSVDNTHPGSIQELFPLKVGNEWTYDVAYFDSNGTADRYQGYLLVVASTQLHGREMFVLNDSNLYYYVGDSDLYWLYNRGDSVGHHYVHCPRSVGDTYTMYDTTYYGNEAIKYREEMTLVRANVQLETPAGTFSCFYFEDIGLYRRLGQQVFDTSYLAQYWLVKNIGLVREVRYRWFSKEKTLDYTLWLRKYHFF